MQHICLSRSPFSDFWFLWLVSMCILKSSLLTNVSGHFKQFNFKYFSSLSGLPSVQAVSRSSSRSRCLIRMSCTASSTEGGLWAMIFVLSPRLERSSSSSSLFMSSSTSWFVNSSTSSFVTSSFSWFVAVSSPGFVISSSSLLLSSLQLRVSSVKFVISSSSSSSSKSVSFRRSFWISSRSSSLFSESELWSPVWSKLSLFSVIRSGLWYSSSVSDSSELISTFTPEEVLPISWLLLETISRLSCLIDVWKRPSPSLAEATEVITGRADSVFELLASRIFSTSTAIMVSGDWTLFLSVAFISGASSMSNWISTKLSLSAMVFSFLIAPSVSSIPTSISSWSFLGLAVEGSTCVSPAPVPLPLSSSSTMQSSSSSRSNVTSLTESEFSLLIPAPASTISTSITSIRAVSSSVFSSSSLGLNSFTKSEISIKSRRKMMTTKGIFLLTAWEFLMWVSTSLRPLWTATPHRKHSILLQSSAYTDSVSQRI